MSRAQNLALLGKLMKNIITNLDGDETLQNPIVAKKLWGYSKHF